MPADTYAAPKNLPDSSLLPSGLSIRSMWFKVLAGTPFPTLSSIVHAPLLTPTPTLNPDIILAKNIRNFRYTTSKVEDGKTQLAWNCIWLLNENNVKVKDVWNFFEAQLDRNNNYAATAFRFNGKGVDPDKGEEWNGYSRIETFEHNFDADNPGYSLSGICQANAWSYAEAVLT